jgi:hypothetical protein
VIVPVALALFSIFGIRVNDLLFPSQAPPLEAEGNQSLEHRIIATEAKLDLLVRLHSSESTKALSKSASKPSPSEEPAADTSPQAQHEAPAKGEPHPSPAPLSGSKTAPEGETLARELKPLIHVANDSSYVGRRLTVGQREWDWTIYLSGSDGALEEVECVTYKLHRSFADPVRKVCVRQGSDKAFPLQARGWGTFNVNLTVSFSDGSTFETNHYLAFEASDQ